ncbi:hypothetical protein SH139x_004612 [Planctomycetaceae bacterium SH139]
MSCGNWPLTPYANKDSVAEHRKQETQAGYFLTLPPRVYYGIRVTDTFGNSV